VSKPRPAQKVKLISSLFSADVDLIMKVTKQVENYFGSVDWVSEEITFDRTTYYVKEMGWPLYRRFISFENLICPKFLVNAKLITNKIENEYLSGEQRKINIDPGYISLERLVLATGKNYIHRIYLEHGIYADLTLIFHAGSFKPLPWTYPDYKDEKTLVWFNTLRANYLSYLRGEKN
jgi:hypothetical protein